MLLGRQFQMVHKCSQKNILAAPIVNDELAHIVNGTPHMKNLISLRGILYFWSAQ